MALSPQEAAELRKQLQEIERLSRLLNKNIDTTSLQDLERQSGNIRAIFANLTDEFEDLTGEIGYAVTGFKRLVQEITNSNVGIKETTKSFNKLSSIAERIQSYQKGYSDLTSKDLKKLREQFNIEKQRLSNVKSILEDKKLLLEAEKQNLTIQKSAAIAAARAAQARNDRQGFLAADRQARSLINQIGKINTEYDKSSAAIAANTALLAEQDINLKGLEQSIGRTNDELKQQEKLLGLSGAVVGGLQKSLEKLGFEGLSRQLGIDEAQDKMKSLSRTIIENKQKENNLQSDINKANTQNLSADERRQGLGGDILKQKQEELDTLTASNAQYSGMSGKFKILQTGISSMGNSLLTNLKDPLSITLFLVDQIVDAFKTADSATGNLAKSFNLTYKEASNVRDELNTMANLSMDNAVTTQGLQESMVAVGSALGSNARLNEADLVTMTKLTKQAGYTHEELMGIQKISLINGKTLEDNTAEILGSAEAYASKNKLVVNEKEVLKEVNKASASLKLSLGGSTKALAEAVVKSKQFGINLDQASQISNALLQFEDSISSELEAELLLGKSLNFEKARALALEGKTADAAAEVLKEVKSSEEFGKLNVIQQEALAKAVGMTKDELAGSLIEREALNNLSEFEGKTAKERYDDAVKQYGVEGARKKLGKDALADQFEQQSLQERFNDTIEKLKEIFVSLVTPLMPVLDLFAAILKPVGYIAGLLGQMVKYTMQLGKYILPVIAAYKTFQFVSGTILGIQAAIGKEQAIQKVLMDQNLVRVRAYKAVTWATTVIEKVRNALLLKGIGLRIKTTALGIKDNAVSMAGAVAGIVKGAWTSLGPIPFVGAALAAIAVGAGIAYLMSQSSKAKSAGDVMSPAKGKTQISTKEGGLFELSKNDDVIAAPGLLSGGQRSQSQPQQQSMAIDYDRLAAAISKIQINNTLTVDKQVLANTVNSTNNTTSVQIQ
jgi:hypothetical protein